MEPSVVKLLTFVLPCAALLLADVGNHYAKQVALQSKFPTHDAFVDQGISVSQLITQRWPGLEVIPTEMPLAPIRAAAVRALRWMHMALLALVLGGDKLCQQLGVAPPAWYLQNVATNKFGAAMMVWFVGNLLVQQVTASAAFEVYAAGQLVFSMMKDGARGLTLQQLMQGIQAALQPAQ